MHAVLEVGGSHVTAALVDLAGRRVLKQQRVAIDSAAPAGELLAAFSEAVRVLGPEVEGRTVAVAIPGPFDYAEGVGDFEGVAKFGALRGVDLREAFRERLGMESVFVNDVTAYALGQYEMLGRPRRLVAITLGTGVGSAFLADGRAVESGESVPPSGWVHLLEYDGHLIEDTFSRRALVKEHERRSGRRVDVAAVAELARSGDPAAVSVMQHAYEALAQTLSPWFTRHGAEVVVVGGSIAESWDLVQRWFIPALTADGAPVPRVVHGVGAEEAALIGAASFAVSSE